MKTPSSSAYRNAGHGSCLNETESQLREGRPAGRKSEQQIGCIQASSKLQDSLQYECPLDPLMSDATQPRFGFVNFAETWNGRLAMLGFVIGLATELLTGQGILSQIGLG
ncbi:chlorophyll a/b-binding protein [Synechococcus sp. EJ6-Ellesmere]|uniref:chlorophyll a/b-binding protein n=1 Tax=Synechococcus sp. EJ6-Ellesmere TaxID=2823734 RepID=UPI0020CD55FD|nr:chlorophyll a/b-binding protein [Synechococcus sp. EJ6-Ellesmere]